MSPREYKIENYYNFLRYDPFDKDEILEEIHNMTMECELTGDNFSERFFQTAYLIKDHIKPFQLLCKHVDTINTVLEYLNIYGIKYSFACFHNTDLVDDILSFVYTLLNICIEPQVQSFFMRTIIQNSKLESRIFIPATCDELRSKQSSEMIVLADADLYAVLNYLSTSEHQFFNKVFVQEAVKNKFVHLAKECYIYNYPITVFQTRKDILTPIMNNKIMISSIWSEDVVAAKNLALQLNRDIVFINAHLDFKGGLVLLPYLKLYSEYSDIPPFNTVLNYGGVRIETIKVYVDEEKSPHNHSLYNLFYDGTWQRPTSSTYWVHKDGFLCANATKEDVKNCVQSAVKGAKVWSLLSLNFRMRILSNLAAVFKSNGIYSLAELIEKWIKFPYLYGQASTHFGTGRLEVTTIRQPKGIIVIKECISESVYFRQLIQALITGNAIIVISSGDHCNFPKYCNMFATSKIPPGVVNVLLNKSKHNLLDMEKYLIYTNYLFPEHRTKMTYLNLTISKDIILPLM